MKTTTENKFTARLTHFALAGQYLRMYHAEDASFDWEYAGVEQIDKERWYQGIPSIHD